jgi:hypothetical protein
VLRSQLRHGDHLGPLKREGGWLSKGLTNVAQSVHHLMRLISFICYIVGRCLLFLLLQVSVPDLVEMICVK